ncbi:VOC family protein [Catelliglobosispora koreensis]|uniref:VOC family protein n=1 Tax=Catelliglobosispora koreensis TaxID=129052 RepID=UPI000477583D|nr:VOC family protein [Catelliglobosispora koreensis]
MGVNFQVVVDCADPHRLAAFWSAALGWDIEHHDDFIKQLLASGQLPEDKAIEVDGRLVFKTAAAIRDPEASMSGRNQPLRGRMLFQTVPETKSTKNRVHLDLYFETEDRDAEIERLTGLGARRLWEGKQGPVHTWVTMADPEGNEFCVS